MTHSTHSLKIGFIGTGAMGARMAERLIRAGHKVSLYNRTPEKAAPLAALGGRLVTSPAEAAAEASLIFIMVEGDDASRSIWRGPDGLHAALTPTSLAIECSTLSVDRVRQIDEETRAREARFIEAPVSGSLPQAEAGALTFLAGGDEDWIEEARPVLLQLGRTIHHVGQPPCGATMKLAVNALLASQVTAAGEALAFLGKANIPTAVAQEVLADTPVASPILMATCRQIEAGDFTLLFPVALMLKDLSYVLQAARETDARMPIAEQCEALFRTANERWGELNMSAVSKLFS